MKEGGTFVRNGRVTSDEMGIEGEGWRKRSRVGGGMQKKYIKKGEKRSESVRGVGGMRNKQVWEEWERRAQSVKKEERKRVRAELHLEVLSESADRTLEKNERCVLCVSRIKVKETRR